MSADSIEDVSGALERFLSKPSRRLHAGAHPIADNRAAHKRRDWKTSRNVRRPSV